MGGDEDWIGFCWGGLDRRLEEMEVEGEGSLERGVEPLDGARSGGMNEWKPGLDVRLCVVFCFVDSRYITYTWMCLSHYW